MLSALLNRWFVPREHYERMKSMYNEEVVDLLGRHDRIYEDREALKNEVAEYSGRIDVLLQANENFAEHLKTLYEAFDEVADGYTVVIRYLRDLNARPKKSVVEIAATAYDARVDKYPRILDKSSSIQRVVKDAVDISPTEV